MKKVVIFLLVLSTVIVNTGSFTFAQTSNEAERARLEAELKTLEREIADTSRNITATEAEKQSLQSRISRLQGEINALSAQIQRNRLLVASLGFKINDTQASIAETNRKIEQSQEELSEMLRAINRESNASVIEILLAEDNLSSAFSNINALETLSAEAKGVLDEVKRLKLSLQGYKVNLETDLTETEKIARLQEAQKAQEESARAEQQRLFGMTEAEYQRQVAQKKVLEAEAEKIRTRLFELIGLPADVAVPTFEEAYNIARWVERQTGTRAAFLLSIIQQESALGRNVGQCHLADTHSGASVHIRTGQRYNNGIHPTRDIPPFIVITRELGRNPLQTPVSCPLSYGYGGAMGPAQFIPSTWNLIRAETTRILGYEPDPWKIRDSFMASGVLLKSNGAAPQTRQAEWNAAMRYFSGGTTNSKFFWYADQVIDRANKFEQDIKLMTGN